MSNGKFQIYKWAVYLNMTERRDPIENVFEYKHLGKYVGYIKKLIWDHGIPRINYLPNLRQELWVPNTRRRKGATFNDAFNMMKHHAPLCILESQLGFFYMVS